MRFRQPGGGMRPPFKKNFVPRHPFDICFAEQSFPKVAGAVVPDDSQLTAVCTGLL